MNQEHSENHPIDLERLSAFEDMLSAIKSEYQDIITKMEKLKSEGKTKSVTYTQLLTRKLMYNNMLSMYEIYGLLPIEK